MKKKIDWPALWQNFRDADAKHAELCAREERRPQRSEAELQASAQVGDAIDAIVETPAAAIDGIAVKLALLRRYEGFASGWMDDLTDSALRDAERLAGVTLPRDLPPN